MHYVICTHVMFCTLYLRSKLVSSVTFV